MGYIKTSGIVIKEVNTGEADKIITVLTRGMGKVTCYAKSARRPKSNLIAGAQLLCYSDYVLFKGREMYSINSCDVIESFYEIRNDIVRLTYAAHLVDLINDVMQENQPSFKVLQLFLNTLHMLAKTDKSPELLTRIFELRLLSILGYAPYVRGCMNCGKEELQGMSFSYKKCGFLCEHCIIQDEFAYELSTAAAMAMNHIVHARLQDLFSFNVSENVLGELEKLLRRYLRDRLEKDYTKLDFLKMIK